MKGCPWLTCGLIILEMKTEITVFPRIIARGDYFLFRARRGRLFPILLTGSRALKICFFFYFQKIITSNKLNMGFLSVTNLVP